MNTEAAPTVVVTTRITTTTTTEPGTPVQAATTVDQTDPADTTTSNKEDGSPGPQRKSSGLVLAAALLGLVMGILAMILLMKGCGTSSNETSRRGVIISDTTERKLKLLDLSRCRGDQLKIEGDTLVSAPECTVIVYEDK